MSEPDLPVGRLALRVEGDDWAAYYAMPDTMAFARRLGSIRMDLVDGDDEASVTRKEVFMRFMMRVSADLIEEVAGQRPSWPDEPRTAPEHERKR